MAIDFRTVQGCPVGKLLAPFVAIIADDAHATVNSIYRGPEAASILHRHGKSTQAELYDLFIHHGGTPANRPGQSTHELRSDGAAYLGPIGRPLEWWQVGIDVNDADVGRCIQVAARHGWHLFQPYSTGVEFHHLNFREQPRPRGLRDKARVWRLRATLPRR